MTTRVVTNPVDRIPGDILYDAAEYAGSFRGVLAASQPGDTITFNQFSAYIALQHELVITKGVIVDGTIAQAPNSPPTTPKLTLSRYFGQTVLEIDHADATLKNLTIRHVGDPNNLTGGPDPVGGIDIEGGTVLLDTVTIDRTTSAFANVGSVPAEAVGGILVTAGAELTLRNSTIQNARGAAYGSGVAGFDAAGAILVDGGTLHLVGSSLHNNSGTGGEGGGTANTSYKGGNAAGGVLIRGGGHASFDMSDVSMNYGLGGAGGAGFTDYGGGNLGGAGGQAAGGILAEGGTDVIFTNATVKNNLSMGGAGGRGGSALVDHPTAVGIRGSGGGVGGLGVGGLLIQGTAYGTATGLDLSANTGQGGHGGYGGHGSDGVPPATYTHSPGGGGGAGGIGSRTGGYRTQGTGYVAGTPGQTGFPGPFAAGGPGGVTGQPGSDGYSPGRNPDVYTGGGGGGGGGGGFGASDLVGALTVVACFAQGTAIATPAGDALVETLRPGDLVMTGSSGQARVTWVGHRRIECTRHPRPEAVLPVRIQAGAFAPGRPVRDLFLSPDHAVFADDVLIPVKTLINGTTIAQQRCATITYWHVELDRHDVLLAEGLPCESYLDTGNRGAFTNGGVARPLHPDFAPGQEAEALWETRAHAPLRVAGPAVDRVAAQLRSRGTALGYAPATPLPAVATQGGAVSVTALVQPGWYCTTYPDVAAAGLDPVDHFARWGRAEGRLPCPEVDLIRGLGLIDDLTLAITMPDVVAAGRDPAVHLCTLGWRERRRPNPYFDTGWYLDTHDVPAGMNPMLHYVLAGERQGLAPGPHFDPAWYRGRHGLADDEVALAHFLRRRRGQAVSPLPSFDVDAHVRENTGTLRPGRDPYAHYLATTRPPLDLKLHQAA